MTEYIKISLETSDADIRDMLIAQLSGIGFEGFEEAEERLYAYIPTDLYDEDTLKEMTSLYKIDFVKEIIAPENWNETWEKNFDPVIVDGFCTIRAAFHDIAVDTTYEILITPKMSFGTGHHATTRLMVANMAHLAFGGMNVLDFGTGTGILAILAHKLGAASIVAIDNDTWSFENAGENITNNAASTVKLQLGELKDVAPQKFDVILANINRHILLDNMQLLSTYLTDGGNILMSGLLVSDEKIIVSAATANNLEAVKMEQIGEWIMIHFKKAMLKNDK